MAERIIESRPAFAGRLFQVRVDDVELPNGRRSTREVVVHPGAVAILPWDGEHLALVRQWRHAASTDLLEVPAGTLDPGEQPLGAAARELAEECRLAAATWTEGPNFFTAPGFCTELMYVYLATDLIAAPGDSEEDELIEVEWLTLNDALRALDDGRIQDAKSMAAISWFARHVSHP
jgi:ADP-ribose pyrophosphatase